MKTDKEWLDIFEFIVKDAIKSSGNITQLKYNIIQRIEGLRNEINVSNINNEFDQVIPNNINSRPEYF